MSQRRILIVGGSTRARRGRFRSPSGLASICADLFADLDLHSVAEVVPVHSYPKSLPDDIAHVRADGWFYCGALENCAKTIEMILASKSACGPLLGTSPQALRLLRNPQWLTETLRNAGIPALQVASASLIPDADGTWLQKPLAGAGGRSIRVWDQMATTQPFHEAHYFQRRSARCWVSAKYVAAEKSNKWLGASREIEFDSASHPPSAYAYCGSIGPLTRISIIRKASSVNDLRFRCAVRAIVENLTPIA